MKLLIADSSLLCNKLTETLINDGYDCVVVTEQEDIFTTLEKEKIPILLVNWDSDTFDFGYIFVNSKKADKKVSIVVISTSSNKIDEIDALNFGADDFLRSPIVGGVLEKKGYEVLLARFDARLRFGGTNVIEIDDLIVDPDEEKIFYKNEEIELKGKPFEVLTHLAKHRDQIVSKEQLLDAIWEEPELVTPNVIEVAINQIRQKMDKPLGIGTIETVRRRGYRFCFPNCNTESNIVDPH